MEATTRAALRLAVLLALAFSLITVFGFVRHGQWATDFNVFWTTVRSPDPYAPTVWPFAYPPTMLLWLQPLWLLAAFPAYLAWVAASAGLYIVTTRSLVGNSWPLALLALPTVFALLTGQSTIFVAALIFAAFRSRWTGVLLGIAFTIKPQLVFLAPVALYLMRDWKQIAHMAGTVIFVSAAATIAFGPSIWTDWLTAMPHFQRRAVEVGILYWGASPAALATAHGLNPVPALLFGVILGVGTLILGFERSDQKGALLAACCILAAPYATVYDLAAITPLAVVHLGVASWRTGPALLAITVPGQLLGLIGLAIAAWKPRQIQGETAARSIS